jgi:hypothetical protein
MALTSEAELLRFASWMRARPGAFAYQSGDVMYVTAKKQDAENLDEYLCHELSHLLLYQNAEPRDALTMHGQRWVVEGVAVHFCGPHYMDREEFLERIEGVTIAPRPDEENVLADAGRLEGRVAYTAYRFMIAHLVETYGS